MFTLHSDYYIDYQYFLLNSIKLYFIITITDSLTEEKFFRKN